MVSKRFLHLLVPSMNRQVHQGSLRALRGRSGEGSPKSRSIGMHGLEGRFMGRFHSQNDSTSNILHQSDCMVDINVILVDWLLIQSWGWKQVYPCEQIHPLYSPLRPVIFFWRVFSLWQTYGLSWKAKYPIPFDKLSS